MGTDSRRYRGGPMFYADAIGPATVLAGIHKFAEVHGARYWTPSPLLVEIVGRGDTFESWYARRAFLDRRGHGLSLSGRPRRAGKSYVPAACPTSVL